MKTSGYLILIIIVSLLLGTADDKAHFWIERSLSGALAAVLGGILAATSIIVGVLSASSKSTKKVASNSASFTVFIGSLGRDIKILIACLMASMILPYVRRLEFPLTGTINGSSIASYVQHFITSAEIFILIMAFCVIFEVVSVLLDLLKSMMTIHDTES